MATQQNISFYVGEDIPLQCAMIPVVDISGWTIQFSVRKAAGLLPVLITKTTGAGITILNGPGGLYSIEIDSADTASLQPGNYVYDIQRTDAGFHREITIGTLTLLQPNTVIVPP